MKMYTEAGNAKRAAKQIADKYPGVLAAAPSVRVPDMATAMFYPAVMYEGEHELALRTKIQDELADAAMFVNAADQIPDEPAPAPKADRKAKASTGRQSAAKPKAPKTAKPKASKADKPPRATKSAKAIELIGRKDGATAEDLQTELGWLPHTVRGFISLQNKAWREAKDKRTITSARKGKVTTYTIETAE